MRLLSSSYTALLGFVLTVLSASTPDSTTAQDSTTSTSTELFRPSDYLSHFLPSYPTTLITTESSSGTFVGDLLFFEGTMITIHMISDIRKTRIETWAAAPTSFPQEHVVTSYETGTQTSWLEQPSDSASTPFSWTDGSTITTETGYTGTETWTISTETTYVLWAPQPTVPYMPLYDGDGPMGCGDYCEPDVAAVPEETCELEGLATGCFRQCEYRDGLFWCRKFNFSNWYVEGAAYSDKAMGQVCWGHDPYQLIGLWQPCVTGNRAVGCLNCTNSDPAWMICKLQC